MTTEERNIKLKHLITCMKCEVSGKVCDENCPTQYEAGNMGEIIENLEAISEILEQQPCEDAISRHDALNCVTFNEVRYRMVEDIKALPSVTQKKKSEYEHDHEVVKAYNDGQAYIVDKIKAKIETLDFDWGDDLNPTARSICMVCDAIDECIGN